MLLKREEASGILLGNSTSEVVWNAAWRKATGTSVSLYHWLWLLFLDLSLVIEHSWEQVWLPLSVSALLNLCSILSRILKEPVGVLWSLFLSMEIWVWKRLGELFLYCRTFNMPVYSKKKKKHFNTWCFLTWPLTLLFNRMWLSSWEMLHILKF